MKRTEIVSKGSSHFADLMLFLAVIGWAVSFPVAKLAMNDWGSYKFLFLAGRFWLAFAIFMALVIKAGAWDRLVAHAKPGFWIGITLLAAFGFQYKALSLGSSGEVAFITALSAVLVPVGMRLVFKKHVKAGIWLGLIVATAGAVLVKYKGAFSIDHAGWLAFLGAAGLAAYIILVGYFGGQKDDQGRDKYGKVPLLTMQFLVLATAATLLSILTEIPANGIPAWSNNAVFGLVFMSVVATAGAFFIQTKYQPMTSPERTALVFTLESPLAGLFGYLMLAEAFTLTMMFGAVLIVVGVAVAEVLAARPQRGGGGAKKREFDVRN
jgi:drug/metabolite transporter (DMT)-like permease